MIPRPEIVDDLELTQRVRETREDPGAETAETTAPGQVMVFTIHDGAQVPRALFGEASEEILARPDVLRAYERERDWGANLVAAQIARQLGIDGYLRVNLARLVLDFGRFPGLSKPADPYLDRRALFEPIAGLLSPEARHLVLDHYYDGISQAITQQLSTRLITLAVHTYDRTDAHGGQRPEISLVTRSRSFQKMSTIPRGIFDPLFPAVLCEATALRGLTYRVLLALERGGRQAELNYPYLMPEGSVEIRAQVWFFFRHLRQRFSAVHPATADDPAYQRVWQLLLDVNRRSAECDRLRAYLHEYREAPPGERDLFADAQRAYARIADFLAAHRDELVDAYRFSPSRPSCLGIEVRKDLLCELDADGRVRGPRAGAERIAADIAGRIASGLRRYLRDLDADGELLARPPVDGNAAAAIERPPA